MLNKKADAVITLLIIIIIVIFLAWLINQGWKECRVDSDCEDKQYCGSDFSCHDFKVIEVQKSSPSSVNYNVAAWIIGISLILAALIMKWDTIFKKKKKEKKTEEKEEYIDLSKSHNAEDKGLYQEDLDQD
jgi:uncharacterized protein YpmB